MNWRQILLLYRKEILEFVRDRRTFLIMILVPALLYPGIIMVTSELAVKQIQAQSKKEYTIGVVEGFDKTALSEKISSHKNFKIVTAKKVNFEIHDVFIQTDTDFEKNLSELLPTTINIAYQTANNDSRYVMEKVTDIIEVYSQEIVNKRLAAHELDKSFVKPINIITDKTDKEVESQFFAGSILPGIMLIMLSIGCALIGQEISAGEKEKSTLETILCSPLTRLELICGKYLTVVTVGFSSALINLTCMSLTLANFASMVGEGQTSIFSNYKIPLSAIPIIALSLLMVSFLVSGMTLIASSLARTVQEAGHYMAPITLLLSLPVIVSQLPGIEMEGINQFVPFLNFCLLFKKLMIMQASLGDIFAVLFSTALFTMIVIILLIKIYNSEEILFNHESRTSFRLNRSHFSEKPALEATDAILAFLVMLPLYFFVMLNLQKISITTSLLVAQWGLFFIGTLSCLKFFKIKLKTALSLKAPGAVNLIICFLLTPFCYLVTIYLQLALQKIGLSGYKEELDIMAYLSEKNSLFVVILIISCTPAICEELFFRGVILSGLRQEYSAKYCVIIQAIMFGIAHYSIFRFTSTAVMGALLTIVLLRTGSIFCTILMHMIFNAISCLLWAYGLADDKNFEAVLIDNFWVVIPAIMIIYLLINKLKTGTITTAPNS